MSQNRKEAGIRGESEYLYLELHELKIRAERNFPGAKFASVYSRHEGRMILVPLYEAVASKFGHAIDYASGVFEGSSAMVNERTGIPHVILLGPRTTRLYERSLPARGYEAPIDAVELSLATLDLIRANGLGLFSHPDPEKRNEGLVRAYIRPTIYPASLAGYGINMRPDYPIEAAIVAWAWPDYLRPELVKEGGVCAITGHQRLFPITGKHASNYGAAVKDGNLARSLGADELVYLAPYLINHHGHLYWHDPADTEAKLKNGVICDGPGEECLALAEDGKTLVYTPMRTNKLGGTVLQYIIDHMAPKLGLETREQDITLHDLRAGKYAGLAMVGNAVKVTPMRQLNLFRGTENVEQIVLFEKGEIPENLERLRLQWEAETRGLVDPSHASLLTPVASN